MRILTTREKDIYQPSHGDSGITMTTMTVMIGEIQVPIRIDW